MPVPRTEPEKRGPGILAGDPTPTAAARLAPSPFAVTIPPTANTAAAAVDITGLFPFEGVVDLTATAWPQPIWLKFDIVGLDFASSVYATWQNSPALYRPQFRYYLGLPANPETDYLRSANGGPVEFLYEAGVAIPATGPVYLRIQNSYGSGIPTIPIEIWVEKIPNTTVPVNSPIINNDIAGYPVTILTPDGVPAQIRSFVAGESGAILANGISLWSDTAHLDKVLLYDANLALITTITWNKGSNLRAPISSNRVDTFYVGQRGVTAPLNAKITTVSQAGVLGTEWVASNIVVGEYLHVAPSLVTADVLYVWPVERAPASGLYTGISAFHISTGVIDASFIPSNPVDGFSMGGYYGNEFLPLPDGSVLAMFTKSGSPGEVRRYSATGTLIRTFAMDDVRINHISYGGDFTTVWAWAFTDANFSSNLIEFRISDGVRVQDFTLPTTTSGTHFSSHSSSAMFGMPECCPLVVTTVPLPSYGGPPIEPPVEPPVEPGLGYGLRTAPQRRLRRAPHIADEQRWMTYDRFQLDLQTGVGLVTGQGSDPQIMLRWSNDGGHTWSNEHWVSAGRMGATKTRAIWRQLGRARTRTFEVVVSDPNRWFLCAAYLSVTPGDGT